MPSNAELQAEIDRLKTENTKLVEDYNELVDELEEAKANAVVLPNTKPVPHVPSFGMSEGTREELERTGKAVDPFTGRLLTNEN
ncbi:hypothetical protein [Micromonospora arida]